MIYSSAPNLLFLSANSFTLSFSSFSSYSRDCLLINSVKAASYIISKGVSLSFLRSSDHFDCASNPNTQSQSGLASDPSGALEYLGLFFLSPLPPCPSSSLSFSVLFLDGFSSVSFFDISFFFSLALLRLSLAAFCSSSSSLFSSFSYSSLSSSSLLPPLSCLIFLFFSSCFRFCLSFLFDPESKVTFLDFAFSFFSSAASLLSSSYSSSEFAPFLPLVADLLPDGLAFFFFKSSSSLSGWSKSESKES